MPIIKLYGDAKLFIMSKIDRYVTVQQRSLIEKTTWVAIPFACSQFIRLATSIGLAWLLAPELLGAMVLINTLRTGAELISDFGIGQSIVNDPRGFDPDFYNTAWTLQIVRGILLFAVMLASTYPIAAAYNQPDLLILLPAVAPIFLITGLSSPARYLLHKRMNLKALSLFDFGVALFTAAAHLLLAWMMPTIWALVLGLLAGAAASSVASYFIMNRSDLRIRWEIKTIRSIVKFGKWIFVSSIIFYLGANFDRLYFAEVFSIAALGVYGIAKTYSETVAALFSRVSQLVVFPKISSTILRGENLRRIIWLPRTALIVCISLGLAVLISVSDQFIFSVYDYRYQDAGIFMTILMIGTWFTILAAFSDSIILGMGRSLNVAVANAFKLGSVIISVPLALGRLGIAGALIALVFSEFVRYFALSIQLHKLRVISVWWDLVFFLCFLMLALLLREATAVLGLTSGIYGWIVQLEGLNV